MGGSRNHSQQELLPFSDGHIHKKHALCFPTHAFGLGDQLEWNFVLRKVKQRDKQVSDSANIYGGAETINEFLG